MDKRTILIALCALWLLVPAEAPRAGELDAAVTLAKEYARKTIGDANFVKSCMGFPAVPSVCNAADKPGNGLVCPPAGAASTEDHNCTLVNTAQITAALGKKARQLLDLSGKYTVHFAMVGKETSIPAHIHQPDCSGSSCIDRYIRRQDQVKVVFAAYQKNSISATTPTTLEGIGGFKTTVTSGKSEYFEIGPYHYCQYQDHGEPLSCGELVCTGSDCDGPTTGGDPDGPTTGGGGTNGPITGRCSGGSTGTVHLPPDGH